MSQRNRESRVQRGQGGCKNVHVCTLRNEQSRCIAYLHSVIITHLGPDMRDVCDGLNMRL